MPPDLEPASALPNARSRAEDIIRLVYDLEGSPMATEKEIAELIESDRAAVREAALREAIAVVGALDAEYFEHNRVAGELALRRASSELAKLLAGKVTHG